MSCLTIYLLQDLLVERVLEIAQVFPDHLLTEAFPGDQEVGHLQRCFPDKSMVTQENDALLWLSVKKNIVIDI